MANLNQSDKKRERRGIKKYVIGAVINISAWIAIATIYYFGFSTFFDTPVEHELRQSTQMLRDEYLELSQRYDTLEMILNNVVERDKSVFRTLFESDPYNFDSEYATHRATSHDSLLTHSYSELKDRFAASRQSVADKANVLNDSHNNLKIEIDSSANRINNIPSIQPIINSDLTLIAASFGVLMHPFYKTLTEHNGIDYAISEGSSVFATADGVISKTYINNSTSGQTISIDHGNGYKTFYSHLSKIKVHMGQLVRRGDIIALSGNTGLSLAPHLHYEVLHNDINVDPLHYFFMELTPDQYQRIIRIAQQGMQSFD